MPINELGPSKLIKAGVDRIKLRIRNSRYNIDNPEGQKHIERVEEGDFILQVHVHSKRSTEEEISVSASKLIY